MKGLELSRLYYREIFLPECRKRFPSAEGHFAAGLVGAGSECFGYDDDWSQDHSFGPRLCIWLTQEDQARYGPDLSSLWHSLPEPFKSSLLTSPLMLPDTTWLGMPQSPHRRGSTEGIS